MSEPCPIQSMCRYLMEARVHAKAALDIVDRHLGTRRTPRPRKAPTHTPSHQEPSHA